MNRATATFRLLDSQEQVVLGPGEFIGRSDMATMLIDDPRVSEAHAMVSLRDQALKLIALRGRFRVGGKVLKEISLRGGETLELAQGVSLVCEKVEMPRWVLGVSLGEGLEVALTGAMTLFVEGQTPSLKRGFDPGGDAMLWSVGDAWRISLQGKDAKTLALGESFTCGGVTLKTVAIPLASKSQQRTQSTLRIPMRCVCMNGRVRIEREGEAPLLVSGIPGKIFASLLERGGHASWEEVVEDVWPNDASALSSIRRRFDAGLRRLRDTLRHLTPQREDFISLNGSGVLVVHLSREDRIQRMNDGG